MAWSRIRVIACAVLAAGAAPPAAPLYAPSAESTYPIDLPTALRLAGANNPTANVARARVQQAVAAVDRTRVMWLPTLSFGPSVFYHDGLDQSRSGNVVSVSRGNYTLGIGPSLRVNVADALYVPLAARRGLRAETSRSQTVTNNVQLDVAVAYLPSVADGSRFDCCTRTVPAAQAVFSAVKRAVLFAESSTRLIMNALSPA